MMRLKYIRPEVDKRWRVTERMPKIKKVSNISNLFFGPFSADVEKLALVCFCFVLFFAESTRVV
jgi:hypothetical protein